MRILGIETSCDETGIAVVEKDKSGKLSILSNIIATSLELHSRTGGIIPESAAREQAKFIIPSLKKALAEGIGYDLNRESNPEIDAIAVTYGPGLIGSLLVGVETAKTLSYLWNIPLIPINHMHGHIYANYIRVMSNDKFQISTPIKSESNLKKINYPAVALVVSGGHTDLLLMKNEKSFTVIGGTRDDAAGEAFDKIGRIMGLPYPAGAKISQLAEKGDPKAFILPRPMIGSADLDFSFSGLKTSVLYLVKDNKWDFAKKENKQVLFDLCASVQEAITSVLVRKTIKAAKKYSVKSILLGGGVGANEVLREKLMKETRELGIDFFAPSKELSTDNGAMIAAAGFFSDTRSSWKEITADPELYY